MMKKAIVTGASSGVGYQTAKHLALYYKYEVVVISRNESKLQNLKNEVHAENSNIPFHVVPFDLAKGDFDLLSKQLESILSGTLDVLINNAGAIVNKPFAQITQQDFADVYKVNVFSVAKLVQICHPFLKKTKGHIINISSMGGFQGSAKFPGLSAYSSSKSALVGLSECLAEEFKEDLIAVNALCLGAVQTEMLENAFPGYEAPVTSAQMGAYIAQFATTANGLYNGKVLPVSMSTP